MNNIAVAKFSDSVYTVSTPLWRYDYGQVLKIEGLPLPDPFEVHFSHAPIGTAKSQIGRNGQVTIPDEFLTKSGFAYAWIFLHTGEDDGETRYQIKIPVRERAKPTDTPLTPEEQSVVTQLIATLNDKVEEAQDAADQAEEAQLHYPMVGTNGNWFVWDVDSGSWVDTGVHAQGDAGFSPTVASRAVSVKDPTTGEVRDGVLLIITNETGFPQTAQILNGRTGSKGDKGNTGERGPQGYSGGASIVSTEDEDGLYVDDITGGGSTTGDPNKITAPDNASAGDVLTFDGTNWMAQAPTESDNTFVCTYNVTTSAEIEEAYQSGKQVVLKFNDYVMPLAHRESATYHNFSVVWLGHSTYNLAIAYFFVCQNDQWVSYSQTLPAITSLAAPFSAITDYFTGDYVSYNKNLYRFIVDHPQGAWNDAHVVAVPIADDVRDLAKALANKGTYSKPSDGIPKTDLDAAVQTSLGKADTALQEHQSLNGYATETWVTQQGYLTSHQDISSKADQSIIAPVEATMIATRNYTTGDLLIVGNTLYKTTTNIASGSAITVGTNVSAVILSEQLGGGGGGSSILTWQLIGEYDISVLKGDEATWDGPLTISNLGGLTDIYIRWTGMGNTSTSASGLTVFINGQNPIGAANWLIPTAKSGAVINGYTRLHFNGLVWEIYKSPGANTAGNYAVANLNTTYNDIFGLSPCDTLKISTGVAQYNPDRGIIKIYGAK